MPSSVTASDEGPLHRGAATSRTLRWQSRSCMTMTFVVRLALTVLILLSYPARGLFAQTRSHPDSSSDAAMRRRIDSMFARAPAGDSADWRRADSLLHVDPQRALAIALAKGDHRLLAYGSIALVAPGLDSLPQRCQEAAYRLGMRQLDNTGDVVGTRGEIWLKYAAQRLAERYNPLLLERLRVCRQ